MDEQTAKLYNKALFLSYFTIFYNLVEGIVSIVLGYSDETLTLLGFGIDSFIEVMSGIGIAVMITRIKNNPDTPGSSFEIRSLKVTGTAFYLLSAGLLAGIIVNIIKGHKPETTFWGVVISLVSIAVMLWLMTVKMRTGRKLNSEPVMADAGCTRICVYMSVVLLAASVIYELTGFAYADVIGAAGLTWFSFSEGREAFEKVKGRISCC